MEKELNPVSSAVFVTERKTGMRTRLERRTEKNKKKIKTAPERGTRRGQKDTDLVGEDVDVQRGHESHQIDQQHGDRHAELASHCPTRRSSRVNVSYHGDTLKPEAVTTEM